MSNEQLKHIFDDSVCLTRRQMKDYVEGVMTNEESYAVELHLNSCPFCSEATEGLFEQKEGRSVETLVELDTEFLKDHFSLQHPQIHLNSLTAAQPAAAHYPHKKRKNTQPLWRNVSIAAALALSLGIFWMMRYGKDNLTSNSQVAQQTQSSSLNKSTDQPLAQNIPANDAKTPETSQPVNNGGDPKAPQTLLLVDENTKPAELAKTEEVKETIAVDSAPKQKDEEVVVTAYKVPVIDRFNPSAKSAPPPAAEQIEKMPARSTADVAASTANVNSYIDGGQMSDGRTEGIELSAVEIKKISRAKAKPQADYLASGDAFYTENKYNQALREYKKELNSSDKSRRQKAGLMAARCYLALGQKTEAKKTLEDLVQNGSGSPKREAKKILDELEEE